MKVADAENDDIAPFNAVNHAIWKAVNNGVARITVNHLVLKWIRGKPVHRCIHFPNELPSQSGTLQLVPPCRGPDVRFGSSSNEEAVRHSLRRISSRTCSQGSTSPGFAA